MSMDAVAGTRRAMKELVDGTIRVQIDIDPPHRAAFLRLFPEIDMAVALAPLVTINPAPESSTGRDGGRATTEDAGPGGAADPAGPAESAPNELARKLHVDGYFRNPKLWEKMEEAGLYLQRDHKEWIESLPCLFEREREVRHGPCFGDIVLHHCNSAAIPAAGKGENPRKPPSWYGVPLCAGGHHQNWAHASNGASRQDKQALLERAVALTAGQMKVMAKKFMGIASLREITPEMLADFERRIGL